MLGHHYTLAQRTSQRLCEVTGHTIQNAGAQWVKFELGGKEGSLSVKLADVNDPCILGMDYLFSRRCELNFCSMQLTVERTRVPLTTVDKNGLQVTAR